MTWLAHWLGLDGVAGAIYAFYSGSGSVILPPLLTGAVVGAGFWYHHQCSVHGCFWYARRTTAAGDRACFRHHPSPKRTAEDVHAAHYRAAAWLHHNRQGGSP